MKSFFIIVLLAPLMVTAQKKFSITGKVEGLKEGTVVSLIDMNKPADTVGKGKVKNGLFVIAGKLKEPSLLTLNLDNDAKRTAIFLDNSTIKISGKASDLKTIKIKGSPSHDAFDVFQVTFNPLFQKLGSINELMQYKGKTDSLAMAMNKTRDSIQQGIETFITKYRSSPVSSFLLAITMQLTEDLSVTENRLNSLTPAASENFYGKYLKDMIAETKSTAIGSIAANFTQADTLGTPVSLTSFRGKYVLLDFWASWCGPCRQENPNVVNVFNKFKAKNFTVLGVSLDRPGQKEKWLQAIHADNLTWTHVSDLNFWNNAVAVQYKIQSIPQNFLIGPDGKIVAKNLRGPELESKLCALLGCN